MHSIHTKNINISTVKKTENTLERNNKVKHYAKKTVLLSLNIILMEMIKSLNRKQKIRAALHTCFKKIILINDVLGALSSHLRMRYFRKEDADEPNDLAFKSFTFPHPTYKIIGISVFLPPNSLFADTWLNVCPVKWGARERLTS